IALKLKLPIEQALIDPYFYHQLKDDKIRSIEDIGQTIVDGLINTPKNRIEIWYKGKKVQKFTMDDLNDDYLLFPLFLTEMINMDIQDNPGLYVQQMEIGLIARYEAIVRNFSFDNLKFHLTQFDGKVLLSAVSYNDIVMPIKKKDTLITYQNGC